MNTRFSIIARLVVTLCSVAIAPLAGAVEAPDLADLQKLQKQVRTIAAQATPATVALTNGSSSGTGVIVSRDGLVLSAAHVVGGARRMNVIFPNGKEVPAEVLGANYTRDVAMLRISDKGSWPHVPLGDSDSIKLGDWVVALGHAKGYDPVRTPPVRFARILQNSKRAYLTTDCTLIGGDSGGPLFDINGKLIGIHSSIGNNLSINNHAPISAIREDWKRLLEGERWGELGENPLADGDSPVLGLTLGRQLRRSPGPVVASVQRGGPAALARLLPGDTLTSVDGIRVADSAELLREIGRHQAGETITLEVIRDGRPFQRKLKLQPRSAIYRSAR